MNLTLEERFIAKKLKIKIPKEVKKPPRPREPKKPVEPACPSKIIAQYPYIDNIYKRISRLETCKKGEIINCIKNPENLISSDEILDNRGNIYSNTQIRKKNLKYAVQYKEYRRKYSLYERDLVKYREKYSKYEERLEKYEQEMTCFPLREKEYKKEFLRIKNRIYAYLAEAAELSLKKMTNE